MGKVADMLNGYTNLFFISKSSEKRANERSVFCDGCEFAKIRFGFLSRLFPLWFPAYKLMFCGKCGCLIIALVRSKNKRCKIGKF